MKSLLKNKWFIIVSVVFILVLLLSGNDKKKSGNPEKSQEKALPAKQQTVAKPKQQGSRVLGMSISEGKVGFNEAFSIAKGVGVRVVELPVPWDEYEKGKQEYTANWLPVANQYYPKAGVKIALSLNPIDTNNLRLPKDLKDKELNDPAVIERYKSFVDFAASQMKESDIFFVAIGNEVDVYLGNSEKRWQQYTDFFNAVAPYVKEKFPKAVIGSKITFDSAINPNDQIKKIEDSSDVVLVTYYPFEKGKFIMKNPAVVHDDFKNITETYPNKKIYFAEIGYPSGELNGSSETRQAEFVKEAFAAWDENEKRIPFLNFVWLHDKSLQEVSSFQKYYGLKEKGFSSYLGTLGLRSYEGKDKAAFLEFRKETSVRNWR